MSSKFVETELGRAKVRAEAYCEALLGVKGTIEVTEESPLFVALTTLEAYAAGDETQKLEPALKLLVRLGMLPDVALDELDIRDPQGALEEMAACAVTRRRLRLGRDVVAQHLALLGGVGSSAVRMALKDGPLERGEAPEEDRRAYVSAASAKVWLGQRAS